MQPIGTNNFAGIEDREPIVKQQKVWTPFPSSHEADASLSDLLIRYDQSPSDELEEAIICTSLFKGNSENMRAYLDSRKSITDRIENRRKVLLCNPSTKFDSEIFQLEESLKGLNYATTYSLWLTEEERVIPVQRERLGINMPSIWLELNLCVRVHYMDMEQVVTERNKALDYAHDENRGVC